MSNFWRAKKVLVTGGGGFVGSWAIELLSRLGATVAATARPGARLSPLRDMPDVEAIVCDLRDPHDCLRACRGREIVLAFAHGDGSAEFKRRQPASLFRQNMSISLNLLEAAANQNVERVLMTSSAEVYSPAVPVPIGEPSAFDLLQGAMMDGYAWSKRMTEVAAMLYARQYGFRLAIARPSNLYGPRDSFDESRGRVIPMFIRRAMRGEPVVIWGDGEQVRSFLYVEDFVYGALDLIEKFAEGQPVNFSSNELTTIRELAARIGRLCGKDIEIRCQLDKPSGTARRILDTSLAEKTIGFTPKVHLEDGLRRTIDAYKAELQASAQFSIAHA